MSNNLVEIDSDYEYVLGSMIGNVLNLEAQFQAGEWTQEELHIIAKELENTGKYFAEQQGLGMSTPVESINGTKFSIINYHRTGKLINSIHATVENSKIHFYNNAQNSRGEYYAGHIEYGFHDRGGGFVPARPFMRPALYAVAESSKGRLTGAMKHFLQQGLWNGIGYQSLTFGHKTTSGGATRVFYNQAYMGRNAGKTGFYTRGGLSNPSRNASRHMNAFKKNSIIRNNLSVNRHTKQGSRNYIGKNSYKKVKGREQWRPNKSTRRFNPNKKPGRPDEGKKSYLKRTGKGRGRPPKPESQKKTKKSNPYNHGTIKRDITSSESAHKHYQEFQKSRNEVRETGERNSKNQYGKKAESNSEKSVSTPSQRRLSDMFKNTKRAGW